MASSVPLYQSDSDDESIQAVTMKINDEKQSRKNRSRTWIIDKVFATSEEAMSSIVKEGIWSLHYSNQTSEGKKTYYRCNKSKFRGQQCNASVHLLYNAENEEVVQYRTLEDHTHQNNSTLFKLSNEAKREVDILLELKQKPKAIMQILIENGYGTIKINQLKNYIATYKKKKCWSSTLSLGSLEPFCSELMTVPDSEDKALKFFLFF